MSILASNLAHCSNHTYFASGCSDCAISELLRFHHEEKVSKARYNIHHLKIEPGLPNPKVQLIKQQLIVILRIGLSKASIKAAEAFKKLNKTASEVAVALAVYAAIDWNEVMQDIAKELAVAVQVGGLDGINQLELNMNDYYPGVMKEAEDYANFRAAEMVGKKYVGDRLVDNPDAKYAISDTTRDDLADLIEQGMAKKLSIDEIAESIRNATTFGSERARLIARTEIAFAQVRGTLKVWKDSEIVETVRIEMNEGHIGPDICDEIAADSPYHITNVPMVPIHPNCNCSVVAEQLNT